MKQSCHLIEDLLPLYYDGVCSDETAATIKAHLAECEHCRARYAQLQAADWSEQGEGGQADEQRRIASLKAVRKKLRFHKIATAAIAVLIVIGLAIWIMNQSRTIMNPDQIEVYVEEGDLVARLTGVHTQARSVLVEQTVNGRTEHMLFFDMSTSLWADKISAESETYSTYTLAFKEKGADAINRIYYYPAFPSGLENLPPAELAGATAEAVLLWQR